MMTTEYTTLNEDVEIVKDFAYLGSVINTNGEGWTKSREGWHSEGQ